MQNALYMLTQDRLSTVGTFNICDTNAAGFPMLYASQGFVDLFGYTAAECTGRPCGSLVAAPSIRKHDPELRGCADSVGMAPQDVAEGLAILTHHTRNEVDLMMECPDEYAAHVQVVNRKKSGDIFVCEVIMLAYSHPTCGWKFTVGLQRDITDEISVRSLLKHALNGEYIALHNSRQGVVNELLASLNIGTDVVSWYLEEKAKEGWLGYLDTLLGTKVPTTLTDKTLSGMLGTGHTTPTESATESMEESASDTSWNGGCVLVESCHGSGRGIIGPLERFAAIH